MSACPHPDCNVSIPSSVFACKSHWFSLPAELRRRIWANYASGRPDRILSGYDEAEHYWDAR